MKKSSAYRDFFRLFCLGMVLMLLFAFSGAVPASAQDDKDWGNWIVNNDGTLSISEAVARNAVEVDGNISLVLIGATGGTITLPSDLGDAVVGKLSTKKDAALIIYKTLNHDYGSKDAVCSMLQKLKFSSTTQSINISISDGDTNLNIGENDKTFGVILNDGEAHIYKYVEGASAITWLAAFDSAVKAEEIFGGFKGYLATITTEEEGMMLFEFYKTLTNHTDGGWIGGTSMVYSTQYGPGNLLSSFSVVKDSKITPSNYESPDVSKITHNEASDYYYFFGNNGTFFAPKNSGSSYKPFFYWTDGPDGEKGSVLPDFWNGSQPDNAYITDRDYMHEFSAVSSYGGTWRFNDWPPKHYQIRGYFLEYNVRSDGRVSDNVTYTSTTIYKVTYNANDATSGTVPDIQAKFKDQPLSIAVNLGDLQKTGLGFNGWNTNSGGTGQHYDEGQKFTANENLTLYAQWTNDPAEKATINTGADLELSYGYAANSGTISVTATAPTGHELSYQWYSNTAKSNSDGKGRIIDGATASTYVIPAGKNAGKHYYYCQVTATKTTSSAKAAAVSDVITVNVMPTEVTLTAKDASKTYNGSALTESGFDPTALEAGDTHTFTVTMTADSTITNAGTQPNVIATVDGVEVTTGTPVAIGNYLVTTANGTLTVDRKAVTLTAKDKTQTYNGSALTESGFDPTALEAGDTHSFTVTMTDTSTITNAGAQPNVIATVDGVAVTTGNQTEVGNYLVTTANGTLTVDRKEVKLTAKDASKTYNGSALTESDFDPTALEAGDTHSFTVTMTDASTITNAGTQPNVIATVDDVAVTTGTPVTIGNYLVTTAEGTLTVDRKAVTLTAKNANKAYDGDPLTENGFIPGELEAGDTHEFTVQMTDASTITGAGTQPNVIATVDGVAVTTGTQTQVGNYLVTTADGTLTVSAQGENSVTVQISNWTYGDDPSTPTATASYGVDTVVFTYSDAEDGAYTADVPTEAGDYFVKAFIAATENYPEAEDITGFSILPAESEPATVIANNRTYDRTEQPLVTVEGEAVGGTMVFAVTMENTEPADASVYSESIPKATDAGTYYVWYKVVDESGNYTDSAAQSVPVTVDRMSISSADISLDQYQMTYSGNMQSVKIMSVTLDGIALTEGEYEADASSILEAVNAGTYTITVNGIGNFKDSASVSWTIDKKGAEEDDPEDLPEDEKPTPTDPEFTGDPVPLVEEPDELPEGYDEVWYCIDDGNGEVCSQEIPTGTNAGDYPITIKYKDSEGNHEDIEIKIVVTISPAEADDYTPKVEDDLEYNGEPHNLIEEIPAPEGWTVYYSLDGIHYFTELPQGIEPGSYTIYWYMKGNDADHADIGGPDDPQTLTAVIASPMTKRVDLINVMYNGSKGLPKEIDSLTLEPVIRIKYGDLESVSKGLTFELTQGMESPKKYEDVGFSIDIPDLAPGKYEITVSDLPKKVYGYEEIYSLDEPIEGMIKWQYALSAKAEINEKNGEIVITVYLIWDDGSRPADEPVVHALPEDEIGAYKLYADGTKEYLLFQTYDICMAWLGREDLCRGYDRCFHKEWGDWPLANK
ncbi:MAG: InlB B-repeat-containing protein [Flexilinea sp.]|nr:InlB B-repeat-containing protein [Flexilinea sp.]